MSHVLLPIFAAAALVAVPAIAAPTPSLQAADETYFQMRIADSRAMFEAILDDPAAPAADKAGAARGLARIQWLIDVDAKAAEATLDRGLATGVDLCRTTVMHVRVLREAGTPEAGASFAARRTADCPGAVFTDGLLVERGRAELAWAAAATGSVRTDALNHARVSLAGLSKLGKLRPEAAKLKLGLALQASDPRGAMEAWRDFFWLTDHNAPESFKISDAAVAALFKGALGARPTLADEVGLEALLIRGGFYEEALHFDARRDLAKRAAALPAYRPVAIYFDFRRRFDAATLAFNLAYARGHDDSAAFEAEVKQIDGDIAARLGHSGGDPLLVLHDAFGLHGTSMGKTGGVDGVHMGHVVEDNHYTVEQFGRRGEMRFVSIDNMVSNGYQSWLWDGIASAGGWSADQDIVQVRGSYTPAALDALASFDPAIAQRDAAELARFETRDAEALKAKPTTYLPGLQARLTREARDQVAAKAHAEAERTGEPYERTFLKTFWEANVGHSIYIHEGRHALDHKSFPGEKGLEAWDLEFRAKLSELQLAEFPRMALAQILAADIGDVTPHGIADTKIMQGMTDWIVANHGEVAGYDPAAPAPVQIDKLTDAQIRAIAHGLDPQFRVMSTL